MTTPSTHDVNSRTLRPGALGSAPRWTAVGLVSVGALMLVNGAAFVVPLVLRAPQAFSENGARWEYQAFHIAYLAALVLLAGIVPGLASLRGRTGRTLPRWLVVALCVLIPLQASTVFANAFIVPFLADVAPAALDVEEGGIFAIAMGTAWSLWSLALILLAVVAAARRIAPVTVAALIALGALSIPVFGPVGTILVGAGLTVWAIRLLRGHEDLPPDDTAA